jgi:RNA polymerase sigma factor (sigma-70 family)
MRVFIIPVMIVVLSTLSGVEVTMSDDSDETLLSRIATRDERAFAQLFERHSRAVTRYAWAWSSDRADVQEVVQDTFVTAWEKAKSIRLVDASALPWLLVTCRHHALNVRRRRRKHDSVEFSDHIGPSNAQQIDRESAVERLRWVRDEIAAMQEIDRRICEMCLIDGLSYREAAQAVGLSLPSTAKRLERARARIRKVVH